MARLTSLAALVALGSITVLAVLASAQTPPPETGDWFVNDYTEYRDTSLTVNGSINVSGVLGRLSLTNVTLVVNRSLGSDAAIQAEPNSGGVDIEGCTITATGDPYYVKLNFNSILRDCVLKDLAYVWVSEDHGMVINCTLWNPRDDGITISPILSSWKVGRIYVSGNRVIGSSNSGISVTISPTPAMAIALWLNDNVIESPGQDGVFAYIHADGDLYLNGTQVFDATRQGMHLSLDKIALHLDGSHVEGCHGTGLFLQTWGSLPSRTVLRDVILRDNVIGASLDGTLGMLDRFTLHGWNVTGSKDVGLELSNAYCLTIEDSTFDDLATAGFEFSLSTSTINLYTTSVSPMSAVVSDDQSSIYSWRRFQLDASWQNGLPCAYKNVDVIDRKDEPVLGPERTDASGALAPRYIWDWNMDGYSSAGYRDVLVPRLVDGPIPIEALDAPITFNGDFAEHVVFVDEAAPVLQIGSPAAGHGQNTTSIVVTGTASDPLSGPAVVQLSLDPEPDWDIKDWIDATGIAVWQHTFADLAEGTYAVYARAFDLASWPGGTYAQVAVGGIRIDTTAPRITITAPVEGLLTKETSVIVRGTVDADTVELTVGGTSASHTLGAFVESVPIVEGVNAIVVSARDGVGNSNTATVRVVRDTVAPALAIASPLDGHRTNRTRLLVAGTTEAGTSVTVQGQTATVAVNTWEATVSLVAGTNVVSVEARDAVGNRATARVTAVLDRFAPGIDITAPGEGEVFNTTDVLLYLVVVEDDVLTEVWVNGVNYVSAPIAGLGLVLNAEPVGGLAEGLSEIRVVATDLAGNVEVAVVRVTIDTTPPSLLGLTVADGAATGDPRLPLSGLTEAGASLTVQGRPVTLAAGAFTVTLELREGWNDIALALMDGAGNRNATTIRVLLDTIAPQLVVDNVGPDLRAVVDGRTFDLTGRTEPLARLVLETAGATVELVVGPDGTFSHLVDLGGEGGVVVNLTATDAVGNPTMLSVRLDGKAVAPSWTDSPAFIGGSAAAAVLVVLVVAGLVETTKYSLLVLFAPLYARIAKGEVLDNRTRYALHGLIIENPGLHYNAIIREFGLTNGEAAYHLSVLEREGFIRSVRDGTLRKFYSTTTKVPREHRATPEEMRDRIVDLVDGLPGISQKQIVDELGIGRTLAGYHLGCLVTEGFIEARRDGRFTVYYPTRKRREGHVRPTLPSDGTHLDSSGMHD